MSRDARYHLSGSGDDPSPLAPIELTRQAFARRLTHLMARKGWKQSDLSRHSGVGRDSISTYVNARTLPEPTSAQKLADALGVTVEELYPQAIERAMISDVPALEIRQADGRPGRAWIKLNREVSAATAAQIMVLIQQGDAGRSTD